MRTNFNTEKDDETYAGGQASYHMINAKIACVDDVEWEEKRLRFERRGTPRECTGLGYAEGRTHASASRAARELAASEPWGYIQTSFSQKNANQRNNDFADMFPSGPPIYVLPSFVRSTQYDLRNEGDGNVSEDAANMFEEFQPQNDQLGIHFFGLRKQTWSSPKRSTHLLHDSLSMETTFSVWDTKDLLNMYISHVLIFFLPALDVGLSERKNSYVICYVNRPDRLLYFLHGTDTDPKNDTTLTWYRDIMLQQFGFPGDRESSTTASRWTVRKWMLEDSSVATMLSAAIIWRSGQYFRRRDFIENLRGKNARLFAYFQHVFDTH